MLGLFTPGGAPVAAASSINTKASTAASSQKPRGRKNFAHGGAAPTIGASTLLTATDGSAPTRSVHAFNAPDAEAILGLRRLLVKIVGAKDLPESQGTRRSCSAEVQLVSELGHPLGDGALHDRTGPPNHFTTVKDTAPVWNAEFVADLPADLQLQSAGLALSLRVWDDASSPPMPLGECLIHANELQQLCMREEERTVPLEMSTPPSAATIAQSIASGSGARPNPGYANALVPSQGGPQPSLKLRLAYIDVRAAMGLLMDAQSMAQDIVVERAETDNNKSALETQLSILTQSMREEEERAAFFWQEAQRQGPLGGAAAIAARDREDARVKKAQEDGATILAALKEEKRQGLEAVVAMHNTSLTAFREDLAEHAREASELKDAALQQVRNDLQAERNDLSRQRDESRQMAFENAEQVIEAVEANARAEVEALQSQHVSALSAMQTQLAE